MNTLTTKQKNNNIQVIRALALIMVFLSHLLPSVFNTIHIGGYNLSNSPLRILYGGNEAVIIFFVISGYFMYNSSFARFDLKLYTKLVLKRILRIYPLFAVTMIIGILLCNIIPYPLDINGIGNYILKFWSNKASFKEYLKQFLLIGGFDTNLVNPPIWTLSHEMKFAFFFPLFSYIINKLEIVGQCILVVLLVVISFVTPIVQFFLLFVIGIILHKNIERLQHFSNNKNKLVSLLILGTLLLDMLYILKSFDITCAMNIMYFVRGVGAALILLVALCSKDWCKNNENPLVFLGNISFGVYLIHHILLIAFRNVIPLRMGRLTFFVLSILTSILIGYWIYKLDFKVRSLLKNKLSFIYKN